MHNKDVSTEQKLLPIHHVPENNTFLWLELPWPTGLSLSRLFKHARANRSKTTMFLTVAAFMNRGNHKRCLNEVKRKCTSNQILFSFLSLIWPTPGMYGKTNHAGYKHLSHRSASCRAFSFSRFDSFADSTSPFFFFVTLQVPASPGSSASSLTIVTAISSNSDSNRWAFLCKEICSLIECPTLCLKGFIPLE